MEVVEVMVVEVLNLGGWSCYMICMWDVDCILFILVSWK